MYSIFKGGEGKDRGVELERHYSPFLGHHWGEVLPYTFHMGCTLAHHPYSEGKLCFYKENKYWNSNINIQYNYYAEHYT